MDIPMKYEDVVAKLDSALAREAALREELDSIKRDAEQDTTIDERDRYHEIADSLALAISQHFRVEIGEHSSMNCPWGVALDVMNGAYITDTNEGRERDALQQRLTVAEQRAGEMEGMLAQVVSRCDYSLSCGKDALSKNCTAEIENIKLIAGGCSGWDCFAPIEG